MRSARRFPLVMAGVAFAVCLIFAGVTDHRWEDFYITFRSSINLARGAGLVYQPGERVHSFTSPLGTLLPALFALGGDDDVATRALWCFRLVSAAAFAGALGLAARAFTQSGFSGFAAGSAAAWWALDPKTIDFTINGMESGLLVFFVVLTWWALNYHPATWTIALGFAGLQWTRPDGIVFFAALAGTWAVLGSAAGAAGRFGAWRVLVRGCVLGLLLYLPWIIFAWSYYGSPIPHTMLAKVPHHPPGELVGALLAYPWRLLFGTTALHDLFLPAYWFFGGWPSALLWVSRLLAVGAALAWLVPGVRPAGRVASAAFFLGGFYVEYLPRSPWYYPGWQALAYVAWAFLLDAASQRVAWRSVNRIAAAGLVVMQAGLLVAVAWQMKLQQTLVEDGLRTPLGRWLRTQSAPGDRVYIEPLGYVGFYSGLKMLDYPGLASPEVVAARQGGARTHARIIATLRPEWLVLRPDQAAQIRSENPPVMERDYQLARVFDIRATLDAISILPGRGYLNFDAVFLVYRRTTAASSSRG